ncbi:DUF6247 family protein [Streptomyces mayteni]
MSDGISRGGGLDGGRVREALGLGQRKEFEDEFAFALRGVRITYEVEPLAEVVRTWWEVTGGDQDVVDADRHRSQRDAAITRRPRRPRQEPTRWVDRTGPAVYAALARDDRARFALDFEGAADRAERGFDHRHLLLVVHDWWTTACRNANPEHVAQDQELARRIESGDLSMLARDDGQP